MIKDELAISSDNHFWTSTGEESFLENKIVDLKSSKEGWLWIDSEGVLGVN